MAITDNRTLITENDSATNITDASGGSGPAAQTQVFIQGTGAIGDKISNTNNGIFYDFTTPTDFTGNTFYIWWSCASPGKLETKGNGGVGMRFMGANTNNFFEVYLDGLDSYSGGFKMSVVDIAQARIDAISGGTAGVTGGTVPAVNAIQYVGIFFRVTANVTGNNDNCFLDAMWRLPTSTPGIIVTGEVSPGVPYDFADIEAAGDSGDPLKAWGTVFNRDGIIFFNTPIQFGNASTLTSFLSTGEVIAWEDQLVDATLYGLDYNIITNDSWVMGTKVGSGDTAVGVNGGVINASPAGQGYYITSPSTLTGGECRFLATTIINPTIITVDNSITELRSCLITGAESIIADDTIFQKNTLLEDTTTAPAGLIIVDDVSLIKNNSFVCPSAGDHHAIEINVAGTYALDGNTFSNYGADDTARAAIINSSGGNVTIQLINTASVPSVIPASTTNVELNISYTVNNIIPNSEVAIVEQRSLSSIFPNNEIFASIDDVGARGDAQVGPFTQAGGTSKAFDDPDNADRRSFEYTYNAGNSELIVPVSLKVYKLEYLFERVDFTLPTISSSQTIIQRIDRNYVNP